MICKAERQIWLLLFLLMIQYKKDCLLCLTGLTGHTDLKELGVCNGSLNTSWKDAENESVLKQSLVFVYYSS